MEIKFLILHYVMDKKRQAITHATIYKVADMRACVSLSMFIYSYMHAHAHPPAHIRTPLSNITYMRLEYGLFSCYINKHYL